MKKRTIAKKVFNTVKKKIMSNHNADRNHHADTIIRNHVVWSMGAGLIPIMVADVLAVTALQLDMIRQMCKVYDVDFKETQGKAIVTSLTSSTLARIGAGSVIKMIPIAGTFIGGATVSVFAGASTYALGEVFKTHFSSGGTILDFDPDRLRKYYKEKFEKGKKVAKEMTKKAKEGNVEDTAPYTEPNPAEDATPPPVPKTEVKPEVKTEAPPAAPSADAVVEDEEKDVLQKLKELGELKAAGVITAKEFDKMKKKLIESF